MIRPPQQDPMAAAGALPPPLQPSRRGLWDSLLDLVYPPVCPACGGPPPADDGLPLCESCRPGLAWIGARGCPRCAQVDGAAAGRTDDACGACAAAPPPWSGASAAARYDGALRRLIRDFKYRPLPYLARPLGRLLAAAAAETGALADRPLVAAIPLSPRRCRERGFDQAVLLARRLCREARLSGPVSLLRRRHSERPQVRSGRRDRAVNVSGAFQVRDPERLRGRVVLLVDDVLTTGATAAEATRVLLAAGAAQVRIAVVARG